LDEDLRVVAVADGFLRHQRFGRDGAESTTKAYAHAIVLFLRWCARTGRSWQGGVEHLALFMTWLAHAGANISGGEAAEGGGVVLAGPGVAPARSPSRINAVLTAVRAMVVHAVDIGQAPASLVSLLYQVADDRDLPEAARGEGGMSWRLRARHRVREPETAVERAQDEEIVAVLRACRSARDRLIVVLMARAGLRRGEVARAHLHVVRRENSNGAWAKSRRQRVVPLDFLVVRAFDTYQFERMRTPEAADSDFVFVNLFREPLGAPMRPDAVGELMVAASRRAGLDHQIRAHQLRHAAGSNLADAGAGIDVVAELLGHASVSSSRVYVHPDPSRLRAAVDAVPSPREQAGVSR
jgi:integrase